MGVILIPQMEKLSSSSLDICSGPQSEEGAEPEPNPVAELMSIPSSLYYTVSMWGMWKGI